MSLWLLGEDQVILSDGCKEVYLQKALFCTALASWSAKKKKKNMLSQHIVQGSIFGIQEKKQKNIWSATPLDGKGKLDFHLLESSHLETPVLTTLSTVGSGFLVFEFRFAQEHILKSRQQNLTQNGSVLDFGHFFH